MTKTALAADNSADDFRESERIKTLIATLILSTSIVHAADKTANPLIDYPGFQKIAKQVQPIRESRRVTETEFLTMRKDPDTIVLDARSADKYAMRHIRGAVNLPFTDFTADTLAKVIPTRGTRVLIYCNNNFRGDQRALAAKAMPASLNISTYIALATYGYTNVYELGPLLDVATTKLPFAGSDAGR